MEISATQPASRRIKFSERITSRDSTDGKNDAFLTDFDKKMQGRSPEIGVPEMKANFGKTGERKQNSEDRQARLAKVEGVI